ncbi:Adenosylcobinamide-phosphate synthase [Granulibacter bethesdensis]|uniref:Cobalamin biosynthesis protein CobD n=2 Tax=Granulibacter bethesdensis TaxID=364410 RepID=A0AAN0VFD5_9PROT|nr:Adenosylcobinamide-phosphate synthase [Granulibacter bethesdensis]
MLFQYSRGTPSRMMHFDGSSFWHVLFPAHALILLVALCLDAGFGYPALLQRRLGHPVQWIGALITLLERCGNRPAFPPRLQRVFGIVSMILLLAVTVLPAIGMTCLALRWFPLWSVMLLSALPVSALIAQKSLYQHVAAVAEGLHRHGLSGGREAVAMIVGRDVAVLDEAGISRAAIESLAENFSDGVVAPALWCLLAGLPGIVAYKAINTADSMIGHLSPRYAMFGWAAARLDDLVNLPASRLAALCLALAARQRRAEAFTAIRRDAGLHRSPNAGWPEAAMAGALGLRLAGPRLYHGVAVEDAWMGHGRKDADVGDILRALGLFRRACLLLWLLVLLTLIAAVAFG